MDTAPIIEYFQPLIDLIDEELAANGQTVGWEKSKSFEFSSNFIILKVVFLNRYTN